MTPTKHWVRDLTADLRHWARRSSRTPGVLLVAVGTLAAGIGATAAVFSVVDTVLLRPLPYPDPERLSAVWERSGGGEPAMLTVREYLDLRAQLGSFEQFAAILSMNFDSPARCALTDGAATERAPCAYVSWNLFRTLGVGPCLGRDFAEHEESAGNPQVILLSHRLWQRRFAGDPAVIGKRVQVDGGEVTVIGVLPPTLTLPASTEIWIPPMFDERMRKNPFRLVRAVGRLRPGVSHEQASQELKAAADRWKTGSAGWSAQSVPLRVILNRDIRLGLLTVQGAAAILLLIACANVANLLLLLAANRRKEFAVRAVAGASPWRLFRLFLAESLALACLATAAGAGIAFAGLKVLAPASSALLPRAGEAAMDGRVLGLTILVSLVAGVLVSLAPALSYRRLPLRDALAQTAVTRRRTTARASSACAAASIAMALVLSLSASLVLRSFQKILQVDPGFQPKNVLVFHLIMPIASYSCPSCNAGQVMTSLLERVRALPGVEEAASSEVVPLEGFRTDWRFALDPAFLGDPSAMRSAIWNGVSRDYFRVMGIPLRQGRVFDPADSRRPVVVVNQELARRCFPAQDAVGKRLFNEAGRSYEIVGVVGNVRAERLELPVQPEVYHYHTAGGALSVRYRGNPAALNGAVRELVRSAGAGLLLAETTPMENFVRAGTSRLRLWSILLGVLTFCSLGLAAAGVYALISHSVRLRAGEFGLRMALGARRGDILRLVLRETLRLVAAGLLTGALAAAAALRILSNLLYEVRPWDAWAVTSTVLAVTTVALLASLRPARWASRVEPREALTAGY
ncbi:MAG: ABC transporter permease [Acidobacteria bacterium]|nr:ABC transporter permease [Acidobacteriota bacterium]